MCNPTTQQSYLSKTIVTTIPSLVCTHSTDLCSICFCFVLSISIILSDVEAQMSIVHPTQSTGETPFWRSAERDVFILSCYPADKGEKRRGRGCAVFLLCAVLLHYASCDLNMYCILKKKRVDVRVRQRDKCISPDMLTQSAVSEDFVQTVRGRKKKCCTVTESSTSSQQKELWETPLDPAFCFSLPGLYLELQSKPSVKYLSC